MPRSLLTSWNRATISHDLNGNLTNDGTFSYTHNPRNQLTLVKQGTQTRGSYLYDGLGRRVSRTVGNSTTKPAYDGWNLAQERASNGSVSANYLTGLGLDQPLIRTAGSSTSYYLSDALESIVGLASTTRTVPTTYTYEHYGQDHGVGDLERQLPRLHRPRERLDRDAVAVQLPREGVLAATAPVPERGSHRISPVVSSTSTDMPRTGRRIFAIRPDWIPGIAALHRYCASR